MITEILTFELKAAASLADTSSAASKVIQEFLVAELAAEGTHHAYYGQLIEKPDMAIVFCRTTEPKSNTSKQSSATKAPSRPPTSPSIPSDDPSPALGANSKIGATEIVFFYFPADLTSDRESIMASVDKMRPVIERSEALAVYEGWALEDVTPNLGPQMSKGEKSKVFVSVVGWVDVEAHMRFQGSEDFQQNVHHLIGMKDMRHTELYHVKLHGM